MNTIMGMYRAFCGARIYHRLFQDGSLDEGTHVFVLIEEDCEVYFVKYLPAYIGKYHPKKIIYMKERDGLNAIESGTDVDVVIINRKNNELMSLMYYVVLFSRDKNIRFLSYDKPFGRNGRALTGIKGITEETIFSIGIMGIK